MSLSQKILTDQIAAAEIVHIHRVEPGDCASNDHHRYVFVSEDLKVAEVHQHRGDNHPGCLNAPETFNHSPFSLQLPPGFTEQDNITILPGNVFQRAHQGHIEWVG